jgi:hypothetical protein
MGWRCSFSTYKTKGYKNKNLANHMTITGENKPSKKIIRKNQFIAEN